MESQEGSQEVRIEGDKNHVTQDQSVNIQINLSGAVVDQLVVHGGMHVTLRIGSTQGGES